MTALDSALSGLRVAQQQLNLISTNIANVQTPGYSRKIMPQSVKTVGNEAIGVTGDPIIRKVDMSLNRDLWTQISAVGSLDTQINYVSQIEQFHGSPDAANTISAKIAALKDQFSALSNDPTDPFTLNAVVGQASDAAKQINKLSDLITQLRNNAEDEMGTTVDRINDLLVQIQTQNREIQAGQNQGRSTATFEDLRDNAVGELSQLMDISFFTRGDGVMVVQTKGGVQLADERANTLYFSKANLGPDKYYPASANGVYLGGDPATNPLAVDITKNDLGGKLGALITVRDDTMPEYQAQLDETAYRLAQRFDSQGLRLFTDQNGQLPPDTAPTPNPPGPLTPVPYVGFSRVIQVNSSIVNDPTLLQKGTTGAVVQAGSNEVIRRALNFAFGTVEYQAIEGTRDIRVSANPAGDTLQENLGLYSQNNVLSSLNLAQYTTDLNVAAGAPFGTPPSNDAFTLRFFDSRTGTNTGNTSISLTAAAAAYPIGSAGVGAGIGTVDNAAEQLASYINAQTWPADMDVKASVNMYGQLSITSRGNMEVGGGTMGKTGLDFLGLTAGTYDTTDPYFDVQVGNGPSTRITIEPGDTETDLVNKLASVPGMTAADVTLDANGHLSFKPQNGGDIHLVGGPFTSVAGFSTAGGKGLVQEIFGSTDPTVNHDHTAFRTTNLGPGASTNTQIVSATTIVDYSQKMINTQVQDRISLQNQYDDQDQYRSTLQTKLTSDSGVDVDEELANMITVQSAYAAAARAITTANDMFQELLDSIR